MKNSQRYSHSWHYCAKGFEGEFQKIRNNKEEFCDNENSLSIHNGKNVWRIELPEGKHKYNVVYKICGGKKPWRYIFRPSLTTREAENYQLLSEMNVPIPPLLAYGDERCFFVLKESYIIVEFIEGSVDGTKFMPKGMLEADKDTAELFTRKNFELLAKVHQHNFYHKAFHPRNSLFRYGADGEMELFWIDVARCRVWKKSDMSWPILHDLYTWLKDIRLDEERGRRVLEHYLNCNPQAPYNLEELFNALKNFRRRSGATAVDVFNQDIA